MKTFLRMLMIAAVVVGGMGCGDSKDDPVIPPPPTGFKSLSTREGVLHNMELAFNRRSITEYDKLLDPDFVFILSDGDVGGGLPVSWDRTTEIAANQCLFDRAGCLGKPLAKSIAVDLAFESGVQWVSFNPVSAP
ncbi:MAG TPA: hypothetical protein VFX92_02190, partial [Candidatus Krumholzibacteria bacterium]|nr:hypothetical protein [Candidatus Krumholzibacteria bacterium]